jgi:hypothetical protein
MNAPEHNSLCEQAGMYYYDFLYKESGEPVPPFINEHIEHCSYCRNQVKNLDMTLSSRDYTETCLDKETEDITTLLKLHFAYTGREVDCSIVRPFLPVLPDSTLKVTIPTPITAHLDNCQLCTEQLETIRSLNLSRTQLYRLSRLLAEKSSDDNIGCQDAQLAISSFVSLDFDGIEEPVLKHLCICPDCRDMVYQHRQSVLSGLSQENSAQSCSTCDQLSNRDLFDYVMPYGLSPGQNRLQKSLASHLQNCPQALNKLQELHNTICSVAKQPDSQVVTVYNIEESAKAKQFESDTLYAGYPVKVELKNRTDKLGAIINFSDALKQSVSVLKAKPLLKSGIAAAAMLLLATTLFMYSLPAKALDIKELYTAIAQVKSVHISTFTPGLNIPIEEQWISRSLNISMSKTGEKVVLYDLANKVQKTKSASGSIETVRLSGEEISDKNKTIAGSLGIIPFNDLSDIPPGAQWSRENPEQVSNDIKGADVYDLMFVDKISDSPDAFIKFRFFIVPDTNLTLKIEFYRKAADDSEYDLQTLQIFEYPGYEKIQSLIKTDFSI